MGFRGKSGVDVLVDGAVVLDGATELNLKSGAGVTLTGAAAGDQAQATHQTTTAATLPSGVMAPYAGAAAPAGWLLCDGSAVSRTTYASLFAAIGTAYGVGDGSTTFNLPDGKGRVLVGLSATGPAEVNALGKNEGLAANLRNVSHHHGVNVYSAAGAGGGITVGNAATLAATPPTSGDANNTDKPAYLVINHIIKT